MSTAACAAIVERADPDRFRATMAAPPTARPTLFALYAFNIEVSRAPWVTAEPMIAEMRLQWWRDALEEIAGSGPPRRHEVVDALADVIPPGNVELLDALVAARRWDIYSDAFEDAEHFADYLDATAGGLMWAAAKALGADATMEHDVRGIGAAAGLARFLSAVPKLETAGRIPLVDGRRDAIAALACAARTEMKGWKRVRRRLGPAAPALNEAWIAPPLLRRAEIDPAAVADGRLSESDVIKRLRLLFLR